MDRTTMTSHDQWIDRDAYDSNGEKIGKITDIFYDDVTGRPEWVAIKTGLFGAKTTFVPIAGSSLSTNPAKEGDEQLLMLAFDKARIKDAPRIDPDEDHLSMEEEKELYRYYGYAWDDRSDRDYGYGKAWPAPRVDRNYPAREYPAKTAKEAMTRSEEEVKVGAAQRQEVGKARLRKYVVTERQQVNVPISREEVRVEREPITDANRAEALRGPDIAEREHEVVLHEERPVVTTETVPKERVRLDTDTVTDTESVETDVRKERIDVEGDVKGRSRKGTR